MLRSATPYNLILFNPKLKLTGKVWKVFFVLLGTHKRRPEKYSQCFSLSNRRIITEVGVFPVLHINTRKNFPVSLGTWVQLFMLLRNLLQHVVIVQIFKIFILLLQKYDLSLSVESQKNKYFFWKNLTWLNYEKSILLR